MRNTHVQHPFNLLAKIFPLLLARAPAGCTRKKGM